MLQNSSGGMQSGKSYYKLLELNHNLRMENKCAVATSNPEKIKRDFKFIFGVDLELILIEGNERVYNATLK